MWGKLIPTQPAGGRYRYFMFVCVSTSPEVIPVPPVQGFIKAHRCSTAKVSEHQVQDTPETRLRETATEGNQCATQFWISTVYTLTGKLRLSEYIILVGPLSSSEGKRCFVFSHYNNSVIMTSIMLICTSFEAKVSLPLWLLSLNKIAAYIFILTFPLTF